MKLIKTLIVWLLLLAIPLQGQASVAINFCSSMDIPLASIESLDIATVHAAAAHHGAVDTNEAHCHKPASVHKCSNCTSCGMGAPGMPATWPSLAYQPLGSERIAYVAAYATTRLPDGLERPPHSLIA